MIQISENETKIQTYLKAHKKSYSRGFWLAFCFSTLGHLYSNKQAGWIGTTIIMSSVIFMPDKIGPGIAIWGWIWSMATSSRYVDDANARLEAKVRLFTPDDFKVTK